MHPTWEGSKSYLKILGWLEKVAKDRHSSLFLATSVVKQSYTVCPNKHLQHSLF
jgi:hypothetical protein